jgi:F0F1-type ATP synthase assembly protein I
MIQTKGSPMSTPPQPPPSPSDKPQNWLDNLAARSAGITPSRPPSRSEAQKEKSLWGYAGVGIEFAGATIILALLGLFVDQRWHTSPWCTVIFSTIGCVGGMYLLIKTAVRENAEPPKSSPKPVKDDPK